MPLVPILSSDQTAPSDSAIRSAWRRTSAAPSRQRIIPWASVMIMMCDASSAIVVSVWRSTGRTARSGWFSRMPSTTSGSTITGGASSSGSTEAASDRSQDAATSGRGASGTRPPPSTSSYNSLNRRACSDASMPASLQRLQRPCNVAPPTVRSNRRVPVGGPMTIFAAPGQDGSPVAYKSRYEHFIGGEWVPPAKGGYFENPTPVTGENFTEIARGTADDVERALDAAHGAAPGWGRTSPAERANILNKIADRIEANLEAARGRRDLGQRQGGPGDAGRRHAAGDRPLPLLRRRAAGPGGLGLGDRRRHHRVPLPRAARRGRADHPVELPDPDGDLEAGARAGRRQRRRPEAGRADARPRSTCCSS